MELIGGLLPMNLYMSQTLSNEPMAGMFMGLATVFALRWLRRPASRRTPGAIWTGISLGAAMLSKVSGVLLLPQMVWMMRRRYRIVAIMLGVAFAVCGWYYLRNIAHLGRPFVAGWIEKCASAPVTPSWSKVTSIPVSSGTSADVESGSVPTIRSGWRAWNAHVSRSSPPSPRRANR